MPYDPGRKILMNLIAAECIGVIQLFTGHSSHFNMFQTAIKNDTFYQWSVQIMRF